MTITSDMLGRLDKQFKRNQIFGESKAWMKASQIAQDRGYTELAAHFLEKFQEATEEWGRIAQD